MNRCACAISLLAVLSSWLYLSFEKAFAISAFLALLFLYLSLQKELQELRTRLLDAIERQNVTSGDWEMPISEHLQRAEAPYRDAEMGPTSIPGVEIDQVIDIFKNVDENKEEKSGEDWIMWHMQADTKDRVLTPWRQKSSGDQERMFTFKKTVNIPVIGEYVADTKLFYVMKVEEGRSLTVVSEAWAEGPPYSDCITVRCFLQFCSDGNGVSAKQWAELYKLKSLGMAPEPLFQKKVRALAGLTFNRVVQFLQEEIKLSPFDETMEGHRDMIDPRQRPIFDQIVDMPFASVRAAMMETDWPVNDVAKELQKHITRPLRSTPWTDAESGQKTRRLQYYIPLKLPGYLSRFLSLPEGGSGQLTSWYKFEDLGPASFKIVHRMKCADVPLLNRFLMEEVTEFSDDGRSQTKLKKWTILGRTGEKGAMGDMAAKRLLQWRVQEGSIEAAQSLKEKLSRQGSFA